MLTMTIHRKASRYRHNCGTVTVLCHVPFCTLSLGLAMLYPDIQLDDHPKTCLLIAQINSSNTTPDKVDQVIDVTYIASPAQ